VKNISFALSALRRYSRRMTEHLEQRKMSLWIWRRRSAKQHRSGLADLFGEMDQDAVINRIVPYLGEKQTPIGGQVFKLDEHLPDGKYLGSKA
jgi:hypothetical protein